MEKRRVAMEEDLEEMMYGCGDQWPPDKEAVSLMKALVVEYIQDITMRAVEISNITGKLDNECFLFLLRKDKHKFSRVRRLLDANEELKTVQNVYLTDDPALLGANS